MLLSAEFILSHLTSTSNKDKWNNTHIFLYLKQFLNQDLLICIFAYLIYIREVSKHFFEYILNFQD
jgi:hypothetical protein